MAAELVSALTLTGPEALLGEACGHLPLTAKPGLFV